MDAVKIGPAQLAMLPCENSLAGRVPDIHHLLPESGPVRRRRAFPARRALPAGAARRDHRRAEAHPFARGGVGPGPPADRRSRRRAGGGGGHRRRRAACGGAGAPWDAAIASSLAGEIYSDWRCCARNVEDAAHNTTRFYVCAPRPAVPDADDTGCDHNVRLPRAQRAGGALQGARRVRDQRREHDQAGELHARRRVSPPRSSCATSTATPSSRRCAARWRSCSSSPPRCACWACIRHRRSGSTRRKPYLVLAFRHGPRRRTIHAFAGRVKAIW